MTFANSYYIIFSLSNILDPINKDNFDTFTLVLWILATYLLLLSSIYCRPVLRALIGHFGTIIKVFDVMNTYNISHKWHSCILLMSSVICMKHSSVFKNIDSKIYYYLSIILFIYSILNIGYFLINDYDLIPDFKFINLDNIPEQKPSYLDNLNIFKYEL